MNIKYLTLERILLIHELQIKEFGGSHGLRDIRGLESAVFRPQSSFGGKDLYEDIFNKTAVLIHSIISNHAFVDGNKRTGMVSGMVFLELNGYLLNVEQDELVRVARKIASRHMNIKEISKWLEKNSKRMN